MKIPHQKVSNLRIQLSLGEPFPIGGALLQVQDLF